ncbi:MAG: hypothetical protein EOO01_35885, partial [Chitinophagaceae bacterium]
MTSHELIQKIYLRLRKFRYVILACGIALAALLLIWAAGKPTIYTSRASVFPLTASRDNSIANSALSSILGINDAPQSFSQEASINIVELALSRHTREAVVMEKLPEMKNNTIAEILIKDYNKYNAFWEKDSEVPSDPKMLAAVGGDLLKSAINAKINKNGILEVNFSSPDKALVSPVSYIFIEKLSAFYKDLKIRKAQLDFDFTERKIDSLDDVLKTYDRRAVRMSNTTLFVPSEKIQYQIPKENLASEKDRVMRQRDASASNREEALWRLQKVTPIIATLDRPDPPFEFKKPSKLLYGIAGFAGGALLASLLLLAGLFWRYIKEEIHNAVFSPAA